MVLVCFFNQKTAYEMRISDWSPDVCSSDLQTGGESTTALVATWTVYFPIYLGSNVGNEYAFLAPNKKSAIEYTTPSAYQSTIGIEYQISVNAKIGRAHV